MFYIFLFSCFSVDTHAISVDAGSTSTRIYIYSLTLQNDFPEIIEIGQKRINIKLQDSAYNSSVIPSLVNEINSYAKEIISNPKDSLLYIYGTGGMREIDSSLQSEIITNLIQTLKEKTDFAFSNSSIRVISGEEEGFYLWLAANYERNQYSVPFTVGVLDLGGSSLQISYDVALNQKDQATKSFNVRDFPFNVYSHSFADLGILQLLSKINNNLTYTTESAIPNPCLNNGYNLTENGKSYIGAMDFDKCESYVHEYLVSEIENTARPDYIDTVEIFYNFGSFNLFARFAGLPASADILSFRAESQAICDESSDYIEGRANGYKYAYTYCLQGIMIYNIIKNAFKFPDSLAMMYTEEISGTNVSWTLGSVFETYIPLFEPESKTNTTLIAIIVVACVIVITGIGLFIFFFLYKRKKRLAAFSNALNSKSLLGSY